MPYGSPPEPAQPAQPTQLQPPQDPGYGASAGAYSPGAYAPNSYAPNSYAPGAYAPSTYSPNHTRRPGTVIAGAVLTWVGSGCMIGLALALTIIAQVSHAVDEEAIGDTLTGTLTAAAGAVAVISVLAVVLSILAFRGSKGAAIALMILAALYAAGNVAAIAHWGQTTLLLPVIWVLLAGILMVSGGRWYDARKAEKRASAGY